MPEGGGKVSIWIKGQCEPERWKQHDKCEHLETFRNSEDNDARCVRTDEETASLLEFEYQTKRNSVFD